MGSTTCESAKVNLFAFHRALLGNRILHVLPCQCSHFVQPVVQPYGRVRKVAKKYVSHVEITKNGGAVEIIKYKKFLSFLIIQKQENKRHQLVVGQALEMVATPKVTPA